MLCCQLLRTGPLSKYAERGSIRANRRSQPSPTFRRSRSTQGARNDTATMFSKVGRSRCQPGARRILRHHELFTLIRRCAADLACDLGQSSQVVGDAGVGARLLACKNIFVSKAVDPAVAQVAVKFERFEW